MFRAKHHKSNIGSVGENIACEFLKKNGYSIIERNYRKPWGEIDIISATPSKKLVFVEVKTMRQNHNSASNPAIIPEDNATSAKLRKLYRTCEMFVAKHPELINEELGWQIDLIAITLGSDYLLLTNINKNCDIKHYHNV